MYHEIYIDNLEAWREMGLVHLNLRKCVQSLFTAACGVNGLIILYGFPGVVKYLKCWVNDKALD